jgi:hypothetical protein
MKTKPFLGRRSSLAARRLVIAALICCSSIASAQDGDGEDGVVFGTVIVGVAKPAANSSLMRGRKLDETKWGLRLSKDKAFFFHKEVGVKSGSEEHFFLKLAPGSYTFDQLIALGFANFYFPVGVRFDVTPGTITYIGKLEIYLPYRMYEGPAEYNVADSQAEAVEALKGDHPELAGGVTARLMVLEK